MGTLRNFVNKLHQSTKRNYLKRMMDNKVHCMKIAKKYEKLYWDGSRRYGYGGYKYIPGRFKDLAKKLIKTYKLKNGSKILDVGCGKGYLHKEILKLQPNIIIYGMDISKYAIKEAKKTLKSRVFVHRAENKYPFKNDEFDLVISLGTLHNLNIFNLERAIKEIQRVGKKKYIMLESYRNDEELFNLQCWALTCNSFFSKKEWIWIYKKFGFTGDYEFIYFS